MPVIGILADEERVAAVFTGEVEAQPVERLPADAETEQRARLDVLVVHGEIAVVEAFRPDAADIRIGLADVALEIDAAIGRRRRRNVVAALEAAVVNIGSHSGNAQSKHESRPERRT